MYVAWDTETSGLPKSRVRPSKENIHAYDSCRLVSLAAVRYSSRGRELKSFYTLIRPDGYSVGATEIHGITHEEAVKHGKPFKTAFQDFVEFIGQADTLVAHNSRFDENVLRSEVIRAGLDEDILDRLDYVCTLQMYKSTFFRTIKLIDLYTQVYGKGFADAHNALNDARACGEVYPHLRDYTRLTRPLPIPKIVIKASQVSAALDMSFFNKPHDLVDALWRKYSPNTFGDHVTQEQMALNVIQADAELSNIYTEATEFTPTNASDVKDKLSVMFAKVEEHTLQSSDVAIVKDQLRRVMYTNHGTRNEDKVARAIPKPLRRDNTFYTYDVCVIHGTLYQLCGRIDRVSVNPDNTRTIHEIKNRMKPLSGNALRDYDEVQCRTYLAMVPDADSCVLTEQYNDQRKQYLVLKDDEKWKDILKGLQNFCEHFHSLLSSA